MQDRFPEIPLHLAGSSYKRQKVDLSDEVFVHKSKDGEQSRSASFIQAMEEFENTQEDNPQASYRLSRYEVILGFPAGFVYDKATGRAFPMRPTNRD